MISLISKLIFLQYLTVRPTKEIFKHLCIKLSYALLSVFFVVASINKALAINVVRDSEIENTLRYFINPLLEKANFDQNQVTMRLVLNPELNAFVAGGQNIFIHSGLITVTEHPYQIIGVMAHELGHIAAGHLALLQDDINRAKKIGLLGSALSIPLALLAGDSNVATGGIIGSQGLAQRSVLAYSRDKENSADQFALSLMNKNQLNTSHFVEFMKKMFHREQLYGSGDSYLRTHPTTKERIKIAESWTQTYGTKEKK